MSIRKLFRVREWLVTKLLFNSGFVLAVFYYTKPDILFIIETVALMSIYIMSIGAFGYFVNDWFDSDADRLSGKSNKTSMLALPVKILIALFLIFMGSFPHFLLLPGISVYFYLLAAQIILFLLYSIPPIRLKSNVLGVIADSMFSFVLPAFISLLIAIRYPDEIVIKNSVIVALTAWLFFTGLRSILFHQQKDYENDIISKTQTFTVQIGKEKALLLIKMILPAEIISFFVLAIALPSTLGIAFLFSMFLYFVIEWLILNRKNKVFNSFIKSVSQLNVLYNYYFFAGIALLMSIRTDYTYGIIVLTFVVLRLRNEIFYLLKKFYHRIILFVYYKSLGAINKIRRLSGKKK